jgi:hypothetical protein
MVKGKVIPPASGETAGSSLFDYDFSSFYHWRSGVPPIKQAAWQSRGPMIEARYRSGTGSHKSICSPITYEAVLTTSTEHSQASGGNEFLVYPNPFTTYFVVYHAAATPYEVRLYNILGHEVLQEYVTEASATFNTALLPRGIYFLYVENGERQVIRLSKYSD